MLFTLSERLPTAVGAVRFGSFEFPAPSVLNDIDGVRHLFAGTSAPGGGVVVAAEDWLGAHAVGVRTVCWTTPTGAFQWVPVEDFIERRTSEPRTKTFRLVGSDSGIRTATDPLSYREMVNQEHDTRRAYTSNFVHLHAHSEYSPLDGMSTIQEMVDHAAAQGDGAIAVTDHGYCAAHFDLNKVAAKAGVKPIFGLEANFIHNRLERPDQSAEKEQRQAHAASLRNGYRHLILWAMNDVGLRNLWAMSTEAHRTGFYYRPRVDWELLKDFNEGLMVSTACLRGPLAEHIMKDRHDLVTVEMARLLSIFGDRLYVELHTNHVRNDEVDQHKVNEVLVGIAKDFSVPVIAVVDSHYSCAGHHFPHQVWLAIQTDGDVAADDKDLFAGDECYHLHTVDEVRRELSYLPSDVVESAIAETVSVAERCDVVIRGKQVAPTYTSTRERDVERLIAICEENWHRTRGPRKPDESVYLERLWDEMRLIIDAGFCGYFLIVADYVGYAKQQGILVGPGRGSGAGSLVAYLARITEIDPVQDGLLFERFLTPGRKELPDFDVDFPTSKRDLMQDYIRDRYGADHVLRIGSHIRLKNKGVIRDAARAMKSIEEMSWSDLSEITKIMSAAEADKAGLGISWDDLWVHHGDQLEPYRLKYPRVFEVADALVGRLKSYGQHAAGWCISVDEPLDGRLPLRRGTKDYMVSEPDMAQVEDLGLVKFDFLTVRTLDTLTDTIDLIEQRHGVRIDPYGWDDEFFSENTWDMIRSAMTLGLFQVETSEGTKWVKNLQPGSVSELADVITLIRPGPMRSGLTDQYLRRKHGHESVSYEHPLLENVLSGTFGCMIYQEDIMNVCKVLGNYSGPEADEVRKILGKKKLEAIREERTRFVTRCVANDVPQTTAERIFDQMEEFAKYSFNRSHALSYAVVGYWCAWLKANYPAEFMCSLLSTVDKDRIPEIIRECSRLGITVLPPDIHLSQTGFSIVDGDDGSLSIIFGLERIKDIGMAAARAIIDARPYADFADFWERRPVDVAVTRKLVTLGAWDRQVPNRRALLDHFESLAGGEDGRCVWKTAQVDPALNLPCAFDWSSEPVPLTKTGREGKRKPPPKRCTTACRNYTPRGLAGVAIDSTVRPFSEEEIRKIEIENLGVYLSSTPFDSVLSRTDALGYNFYRGSEMDDPGVYLVLASVARIKPHRTSQGKEMAFLTLFAQDADIDMAVFGSTWEQNKKDLILERLVFATVEVGSDGRNRLVDIAYV